MKAKCILIAFVLFCVSGNYAWGDTKLTWHFDANSPAPKMIDLVHKSIDRANKQGYLGFREDINIHAIIEDLVNDDLIGISVAERQKYIKKLLGIKYYDTYKRLCVQQLTSSDLSRRQSAIRSLGYPLFAFDVKVVLVV